MIQVNGVTKKYGAFTAIQDVTFEVKKGEILGFLGPNGAGKTTTMRILTGYMPPTSGEVKIANYDIMEDSLKARHHIGYLPETVPLYDNMSVYEYLDFVASIRKTDKRGERIEYAMEQVGIDERADSLIGKLSKGLRQRVGIAQALVHDPDVLVLDEPTIGLDPRQIIEVRELIRELGKEHTVILSTHILPEVEQVCSRVLIINKGSIVAEDTPEQLTSRLKGAERIRVQVEKGLPEIPDKLASIPGVKGVQGVDETQFEIECTLGEELRPEIAAAVVNNGWGLLEMKTVGMSLEQIFLQLTDTEEEAEEMDEEEEEQEEQEEQEEAEGAEGAEEAEE